MKFSRFSSTLLPAMAGLVLSFGPTAAQAVTVAEGDLLLGFRKAGSASDLIYDLGPAANFKTASSGDLAIGSILSDLNSVFGNGTWQTDGTIKWGLFAVTQNGVNGDPTKTRYAGIQETTFGTPITGTPFLIQSNSATTTTRYETVRTNLNSLNQASIASNSNGFIQTVPNSWTWDANVAQRFDTVFNSSFTGFEGLNASGIVGNSALDLFRYTTTNNGVENSVESYLGSFKINSGGVVSFSVAAVPEPGRASLMIAGLAAVVLRRRRKSAVPA